jgi:hypothetical protein
MTCIQSILKKMITNLSSTTLFTTELRPSSQLICSLSPLLFTCRTSPPVSHSFGNILCRPLCGLVTLVATLAVLSSTGFLPKQRPFPNP